MGLATFGYIWFCLTSWFLSTVDSGKAASREGCPQSLKTGLKVKQIQMSHIQLCTDVIKCQWLSELPVRTLRQELLSQTTCDNTGQGLGRGASEASFVTLLGQLRDNASWTAGFPLTGSKGLICF